MKNSWKLIFASCCLWKYFPCKNCWNAWRSGSQFPRVQVNMANEAKSLPNSFNFGSIDCGTCNGSFHGEEWALLLINAACRSYYFQCISSICWIYFSDVIFRWDAESCSASDGQQITEQWPWPFLCAKLALGIALKLLLVQWLSWVSSLGIKCTFHNPIKKWFIVPP